MADVQIYALQCPGCGAKLSVAKSLEVFGCSYCGATIKLAQSGGTVALELLTGHLEGVRRGTDKTAAELALRRLNETLATFRRDKDDVSTQRKSKREEFLVARFQNNTRRIQIVTYATVAALICVAVVANVNGLAVYVSALMLLAIVGVGFVLYRESTRNRRSIDLKEQELLGGLTDRDSKLTAQIESITKRIAEAQKIADA
jgi:hypothetical protein